MQSRSRSSRAFRSTLSSGCTALLLAGPALIPTAAGAAPGFSPGANIQYDWARFDSDDTRLRDDDAFRRARLGFKVKGERWQLVAEHDFADNTPPDAFLELTPAKGHGIRIGQFKQPFLLEDAVSDKHSPLLEQSLLGAFGISRRLGIEYARFADWGTVNTAVFSQRLDGTIESVGIATRATRLLRERDGEVMHIGGGFASESPDTARASFSASTGSALTDVRVGGTGGVVDVDRIDRGAIEGLWIRNAWSLQGELARVLVQRDGADFRGDAQSLLFTWSPTGDARSYKRGVVGAPSTGDGAAWELALRWSAIDLDDDAIAGGEVRNLGVGATCYANRHLRVATNLVKSARAGAADRPLVAELRVQLTY